MTGLDVVERSEVEQEWPNRNTKGLDDIKTGQDVTDRNETTWKEKRWDRMGQNFDQEARRDRK